VSNWAARSPRFFRRHQEPGTEQAVDHLAVTRAYEGLVHGVNWFRRLLGPAFVILMIVRVARGWHA